MQVHFAAGGLPLVVRLRQRPSVWRSLDLDHVAANAIVELKATLTSDDGQTIERVFGVRREFLQDGGSEPSWDYTGFPFTFGRSVYFGIDGQTSTLGSGDFVAFPAL
jgi:hypothetical protein